MPYIRKRTFGKKVSDILGSLQSGKTLSLLSLFLITIALPITVILLNQQTQYQQHASGPTNPYLEHQELITTNCSPSVEGCGWSNQKSRIVRTSDDTVYVTYISDGGSGQLNDKNWHLMKRARDGTWQEIATGVAGGEPVSLLRSPNDDLWVVAFPLNSHLEVTHFVRQSDGSYTSSPQDFPTSQFGTTPTDATYSGAGINTKGNIVIDQTSWTTPQSVAAGNPKFARDIYWTYYNPSTNQWTYHDTPLDYSRRYLYVFPGLHNDLSFFGNRDDQRTVLGYPPNSPYGNPPCQSWALMNAITYFNTFDVDTQQPSYFNVKEEPPTCSGDLRVIQENDAYIDTQGRMHVLYEDPLNVSIHHAIIQNGQIIKDVTLSVSDVEWSRIVQDTTGKFYIISASPNYNGHGYLTVYPSSAGDTDGTQLDPVVTIDLGVGTDFGYCSTNSSCQSPHLAVPRGGTPLADYVDGFYEAGNGNRLIYFRLRLTGNTTGGNTPTTQPTATPTSLPAQKNTPTPFPPSSSGTVIYEDTLASGWSAYANNGTVNTANTSPVYSGNQSIIWNANAWGTLALGNPQTINTGSVTYLQFSAQAGQVGSHYGVQLIGKNGTGLSQYLPLANYGGDPVSGAWKVYTIPLSDLNATATQIQAIGMQNYSGNSNQVLYLDQIQFTQNSTNPNPTTAPVTGYSVYSDSLASGWTQYTNNGSVNLFNGSPVYSGNSSIVWNSNGWGTFSLGKPTHFDTTPYHTLHFAAQAGGANTNIVIQLIGSNGTGLSQYLSLVNYGGQPNSGQWKVYNIPLSDLNATATQIQAIGMQNFSGNSQVVFLGDISFQ